ncbi:unnamed protein product, partial [Cladocopium goreaui]
LSVSICLSLSVCLCLSLSVSIRLCQSLEHSSGQAFSSALPQHPAGVGGFHGLLPEIHGFQRRSLDVFHAPNASGTAVSSETPDKVAKAKVVKRRGPKRRPAAPVTPAPSEAPAVPSPAAVPSATTAVALRKKRKGRGSPPSQSSVPTGAPAPVPPATAAAPAAALAAEELAAARALVAELTIRGREACEAKLRSLADADTDATAQGPALAHCAERGLEVCVQLLLQMRAAPDSCGLRKVASSQV